MEQRNVPVRAFGLLLSLLLLLLAGSGALQAAVAGSLRTAPDPLFIVATPPLPSSVSGSVWMVNEGTEAVTWVAAPEASGISVTPSNGTLAPGAWITLTVSLDTYGGVAPGLHDRGTVRIYDVTHNNASDAFRVYLVVGTLHRLYLPNVLRP